MWLENFPQQVVGTPGTGTRSADAKSAPRATKVPLRSIPNSRCISG